MKFLVDAHLPPGLCALLQAAGHDAIHTTRLPAQNKTSDQVINELSVTDTRVVISKDTDFYYSHVLHDHPWKLLLVRTGNIRTRDLKELFQRQLPAILQLWKTTRWSSWQSVRSNRDVRTKERGSHNAPRTAERGLSRPVGTWFPKR